jgi:hypothetical protein
MISFRVIADSLAPCGTRLTTGLAHYPRSIHSEIMTHRELSRGAGSSRAIPTEKLLKLIEDSPFVPKYIGQNQRGMQAGAEVSEEVRREAEQIWLDQASASIAVARRLAAMNIHKQVVNRLTEPFAYITVLISTTSHDNLFALRDHEAAEPHFQELARVWRQAVKDSTPVKLNYGDWHRPFIDDATRDEVETKFPGSWYEQEKLLNKISVGRCARLSYLTHEGKRSVEKDIELHDTLMVQDPLHASPSEHVAQALDYPSWYKDHAIRLPNPYELQSDVVGWMEKNDGAEPTQEVFRAQSALAYLRSGNFLGWRQYRKMFKNECAGGRRP